MEGALVTGVTGITEAGLETSWALSHLGQHRMARVGRDVNFPWN